MFGKNAQFTEDPMAKKMLALMLEDLHANRKEEYMSAAGLALLFDRAGGKLTEQMGNVVAEVNFCFGFQKQLLHYLDSVPCLFVYCFQCKHLAL